MWQDGRSDKGVAAQKVAEERGGHWTEKQHLQMGALHEELPEVTAHGAEHHWQRDEAEKALGREHAERLLAEQACAIARFHLISRGYSSSRSNSSSTRLTCPGRPPFLGYRDTVLPLSSRCVGRPVCLPVCDV